MIHYQLRCSQAHAFDGWFRDSGTFEEQTRLQLVECPECGDMAIERALMAPALTKRVAGLPVVLPSTAEGAAATSGPSDQASSGGTDSGGAESRGADPGGVDKVAGGRLPAQMLSMLQRMRAEVEKNCDYVGSGFANEARKMHRGESEYRGIYGETTEEQAESLADEGISVARIPWVPRADG